MTDETCMGCGKDREDCDGDCICDDGADDAQEGLYTAWEIIDSR
jgi:hypothetical protein